MTRIWPKRRTVLRNKGRLLPGNLTSAVKVLNRAKFAFYFASARFSSRRNFLDTWWTFNKLTSSRQNDSSARGKSAVVSARKFDVTTTRSACGVRSAPTESSPDAFPRRSNYGRNSIFCSLEVAVSGSRSRRNDVVMTGGTGVSRL